MRLLRTSTVLLVVLFIFGCELTPIMLLSDRRMIPYEAVPVTYKDKAYNCLFIYTINDLNAVFKSEEFERIDLVLSDGRKMKGKGIRIDGDEVKITDLNGDSRIIQFMSVEKFILHRKSNKDIFHLPVCSGVPVLNMYNERVRNQAVVKRF